MAGETPIGGIVGFLRLDSDQFTRAIDEAIVKTEILDGKRVDIEVNVDRTGAAAAELGVLSAEADKVDTSVKKVDTSSRSARGGVGALATAIIALGPAVLPVAAGAAGLAAAFGGMGAAGVLAIVGVTREMKAGTDTGRAFSASVATAKGDLDGLASVAARNVLGPFQAAVRDLDSRMPALSSQIGNLSIVTGKAAGALVGGLLSAFQALEPLMRDASVYILDLSTRFQAAMSGPGVVAFGDYVRSVFPQVMSTIESLVGAAAHLVQSLAPLGLGTLGAIKALSDIISAIPVDVLSALATAASGVFIGFKAWQGLSALIGGVSTAMSVLGVEASTAATAVRGLQAAAGIIGVAIAALSFILTANAETQRENEQAANDYADALRRTNGVVDESIRQMTAKKLADDGVLDAARQLGIALPDVTSAALGNADAQARVNAVLAAQAPMLKEATTGAKSGVQANTALGDAADKVTGAIGSTNTALDAGIQKNKDIAAATAVSAGAVSGATVEQALLASALGTTTTTLDAATAAQQKVADAAAAATTKMQLENDAAGLLKQSLDLLNGENLSAAATQNAFERTLSSSSTAVKGAADAVTAAEKRLSQARKNGNKDAIASAKEDLNRAQAALSSTKAIAGNSDAAINNRSNLLQQVQAAEASAEAYGNQKNSAEAGRQKLIELRDEIVKNAVAQGKNKDEVVKFIDQVLKIPKSVPPTKADVDKAAAEKKAKEFIGVINGIPTYRGVYISVTSNVNSAVAGIKAAVSSVGTAFGWKPNAEGSLTLSSGVRAMADGGYAGRQSMISRSMKPILWNEAPGGEAYISLAPQKRARSLAIWQETGQILGAGGGGGGGDMSHGSMRTLARLIGAEVRDQPAPLVGLNRLDAWMGG